MEPVSLIGLWCDGVEEELQSPLVRGGEPVDCGHYRSDFGFTELGHWNPGELDSELGVARACGDVAVDLVELIDDGEATADDLRLRSHYVLPGRGTAIC